MVAASEVSLDVATGATSHVHSYLEVVQDLLFAQLDGNAHLRVSWTVVYFTAQQLSFEVAGAEYTWRR